MTTEEFAAHGLFGARVAPTADANKRSTTSVDKDTLFAAVLERQLSECVEMVPIDGIDLAIDAGWSLLHRSPAGHAPVHIDTLDFRGRQVPAEPHIGKHWRVDAVADAHMSTTDHGCQSSLRSV